jgi:hypothetical protein
MFDYSSSNHIVSQATFNNIADFVTPIAKCEHRYLNVNQILS